jgi:hypothetical protein
MNVLSYCLYQLRNYKDDQSYYYTTAPAFQPTIYGTGTLAGSINRKGDVGLLVNLLFTI